MNDHARMYSDIAFLVMDRVLLAFIEVCEKWKNAGNGVPRKIDLVTRNDIHHLLKVGIDAVRLHGSSRYEKGADNPHYALVYNLFVSEVKQANTKELNIQAEHA